MAKITIIALDLPKTPAGIKHLEANFQEQLKLLITKIREAYAQIKKDDPEATVVIVWRENGLINSFKSLLGRILTPAQIDIFKSELKQLTASLKDLYLIGGSLSHYKTVDKIKNATAKTRQYLDGYAKFSFVAKLESKREFTQEGQTDYYKHFSRFRDAIKTFQIKIESTNYNFFKGETIAKHKKVAPFYELPEDLTINGETIRFIYAFNDKFPVFYINAGGRLLPAVVEICREGVLGVVDNLVEKKLMEKPYFRFVIADSIDANDIVNPKLARYTIHVDSDPNESVSIFEHNDESSAETISLSTTESTSCDKSEVEDHLQESNAPSDEPIVEFYKLDAFASNSLLVAIKPKPIDTQQKLHPSLVRTN